MPQAPLPRAHSSLARSTLLTLGVGIAAVIALCTFVSYQHIFQSFRTEALTRMERNVSERSRREQAIFLLAQDNHAILKRALEERLRAGGPEEPRARFDSLFVALPDGSIRNRPEGFDGTRMPGVFVPRGVRADAALRRELLAAYDVLVQYGPAFHVRFTNTYITLPSGAIVLYWPERPRWCQEVEPAFQNTAFEFFTISTPENDPQRKTVWTGIFGDPVAQAWMVSASTPVDVEGRHVATLSHDILIEELMARTASDHLPGAYNMLFREDGQLIAHPSLDMEGATEAYNILGVAGAPGAVPPRFGSEASRAHLRRVFEQVRRRAPGQTLTEVPEHDEYLATAELTGPGWTFVTVLPEAVVSSAALRTARYVLAFGVLSLLLELAIMYWVLRRQITRPLFAFTQASAKLADGDFNVRLDASRRDELGQLAHAFLRMASEVQRREESLRQANEGLEQRVEARTQELKEVHRQFVETARQVGRAEVATNVLHNVGNVLNSVQTSALLAQERLSRLKVEGVERAVSQLEAHRGDLATFLTQDERGRHALPFLDKLGQHMRAERNEIQTLLGDIHRHTEHIGSIVKLQQRYARLPVQLFEPSDLGELLEDALRINHAALGRHGVKVERAVAAVPPVLTEKHKVLMILVNLISNAKYAMDGVPLEARRLTVVLERPSAGRVLLSVRDNGVGIAPEMLTRIFQYGFTTREEGHGFGLHSSALAAQELGGTLSAHSEGLGKGATFTLALPATPTASTSEQESGRAHA